ncbi:MAG: pyruvate:ferredoxin (flavodoxin) oxidoreductase [Candidatus Krumholzibacteriia bacterium]|nr:pyruvate:ferredoxin (flavodoxin) oxidoreductase [bacterium]MCB9513001.1 pyruvate:ferredoxin (flavodoxin) oxidoreductase [Candidatus Latescibacterota bacterium]MCB9516338.1 pyruvate:ferredoxin (flavodoxin) oxidoreductase [Candidatus Latescibacterota bacterium]
MSRRMVTIDGNEAAAYVAHKVNEVIAIYPITPSSNMGELADDYSARGQKNIWGTVPTVVEMQSEGGASGAVHGSLQTGALTTTFTASQGLLLMIPNMYKIAGELTSTVFHVSARTVATHALSIFGDHSDVMGVRQTGWALLASGSVQEVMDNALIAQAATLAARVPVLHFFDGFRTSHEVLKVEQLTEDDMRAMVDDALVRAHRERGLSPERPVLRGSAQNPDVFFQAREAANPYFTACPEHVQAAMDRFAKLTGRQYHLFDYVGDPEAERVLIMMGSGAETAHEAVEAMNAAGEKVGLIKVRLYRPFAADALLAALPKSVKAIAVLDRTKEPGAQSEPLYADVLTALAEAQAEGRLPLPAMPRMVGGRYGLSSKEFTPAMARGVLDELGKAKSKNRFTVGINDDLTQSSLDYDPAWTVADKGTFQGMFFGLGADGTVGANKNSIKIIGENTDSFAQGYFVYDSKKSGSMTISHLRFGKKPIRSSYLIQDADFVACHQSVFLEKYDMLAKAKPGAVFLLNTQAGPEEVWETLPLPTQQAILDKGLRLFVIDAYKVAGETGMGVRINTIMQTCFFAISGVLPREEAIAQIKKAIEKTYGKRGEEVVRKNYAAVDGTLAGLHEVKTPAAVTSRTGLKPPVSDRAPEFVKRVTAEIIAGRGDDLPVSAFPADGTFPTDTARWEKRAIALEVPVWDPAVCIQCNKCALICPHAAIRPKIYEPAALAGAPGTFKHTDAKGKELAGQAYTLQVAAEDCTGCGLCVHVCPAKNKAEVRLKAINMEPLTPIRDQERENFEFFLGLPEPDRRALNVTKVKDSQFLQPLFEFSGACAGCGETPYVKLVSQLFGDRMVVANATGCSSIYGGNLPTTPWSKDAAGRGPAWSNSLFEDNAEFGMGFRLSIDKQTEYARELLADLRDAVGAGLADAILGAEQKSEADIHDQRERVEQLRARLAKVDDPRAKRLADLADMLVKKSVWIMGGDGWAYDIGYGGLDHVLASGRNVNVLVMDTEVYSNTGGQMSKATPMGAVAKFAASGKPAGKKDLGMMAMSYGNVYVAQIAMGASDAQTVRALVEAEAYDGPSLIIAYSHCIAHGIDMGKGTDNQKAAVQSGHWLLYRFNPERAAEGENPLQLDSKAPTLPLKDYVYQETRYKMLTKSKPEMSAELVKHAQADVRARWHFYEQLAALNYGTEDKTTDENA